ncbi:unnamed protein product [[Candida] boidinii]|nr:hypothetical protein B5S33_g3847 [[Candida] boidinii]GME96912.1 unnamed protein product [[Candida] boidinii]
MESYLGITVTPKDAILLIEAARLNLIPKITRRLSEFERSTLIRNGSIFIWDERRSNMKRWTDGRSWSASRVNGSFLTYKEMENGKSFTQKFNNLDSKQQNNISSSYNSSSNNDYYRYKNKGLIKQTFSVTLKTGAKLHLISYIQFDYLKNFNEAKSRDTNLGSDSDQTESTDFEILKRPSFDPRFKDLKIDRNIFPDHIWEDELMELEDEKDINSNNTGSPYSMNKTELPDVKNSPISPTVSPKSVTNEMVSFPRKRSLNKVYTEDTSAISESEISKRMKLNNVSIPTILSANVNTGQCANNDGISLTRSFISSFSSSHSPQQIKRNSVSSSCSSTSTISSFDGFMNEMPITSFFKQQAQPFFSSRNSFHNNNVFTSSVNLNSNGRIVNPVTQSLNFRLPPIQLNIPEDKLGALYYDSSDSFNNDGNILNALDRSFR